MKIPILVLLVSLSATALSEKCTNPTPTTDGATEGSTEPSVDTTTIYLPPPQDWPRGRYGLLQAGNSCPEFATFKKGRRYQDTEDYRNMNSWPTTGMPGPMKYDGIMWNFCMKSDWTQGSYFWPVGDYCINMFGQKCPRGDLGDFQTGYIFWDDEDSNNANKVFGKVPTGTYGSNTNMTFCCRNDGDASTPISLPVTIPFYLFRYIGECQQVRGMNVEEQELQFDDEDTSNANERNGATPMDSGTSTDHKLHFCLYTPL